MLINETDQTSNPGTIHPTRNTLCVCPWHGPNPKHCPSPWPHERELRRVGDKPLSSKDTDIEGSIRKTCQICFWDGPTWIGNWLQYLSVYPSIHLSIYLSNLIEPNLNLILSFLIYLFPVRILSAYGFCKLDRVQWFGYDAYTSMFFVEQCVQIRQSTSVFCGSSRGTSCASFRLRVHGFSFTYSCSSRRTLAFAAIPPQAYTTV